MFLRTGTGIWQSGLLAAQDWLDHGFGSRASEGWPGDYIRVRQIHCSVVVEADPSADPPQADGIVTCQDAQWIGIRTADCVPLLLADPVRRCVAAVHAGWRGTVADISGAAVREFISRGSNPADLLAAIGPCIGVCCFEVGAEVSEQFVSLFPESMNLTHVNLAEANRRQLLAAGVGASQIEVADLCTRCNSGEFHSFRRDRELSGRMVAAIRIR